MTTTPEPTTERTLDDVAAQIRAVSAELSRLTAIIEDKTPRGTRSVSTPDAPPAVVLSEADQQTLWLATEVRDDFGRTRDVFAAVGLVTVLVAVFLGVWAAIGAVI